MQDGYQDTLKDELTYFKSNDTPKHYKPLKHYLAIPLLLIDDFLSKSTSPDALDIQNGRMSIHYR